MFSYGNKGYVAIQNGRSNGRSCYQDLMTGRITISGVDAAGKKIRRVIECVGGEIMDNKFTVDGRLAHRIAYGKFETTLTPAGREITRFNKKRGTGKHGKSRRYESLFGQSGVCHSWYKLGRLVRQKFIYNNGKLAYDWRGGRKPCEIRDHDGNPMYLVTGAVDGSKHWSGTSVFNRTTDDWFLHSEPFSVEKYGKVIFAGQYENRQRVGRWVLDGKEHFYEHGVAIPKKLFETPPNKLDPRKLLNIPNAQLRMAMLSKAQFSAKRLSEFGSIVHRQGSMRLYDVPGMDTRILRVTCPSTRSQYHIRVPKDSRKCEEARQWTFHVGAGVTGSIKFDQET
jgi:hypothetical protein